MIYKELFEKMVGESKCPTCGQKPCICGNKQTNLPNESEHAGEDLSSEEAIKNSPKGEKFKATNGDANKAKKPPIAGKDYVNEK